MYKKEITVFTPTYNRADIIGQLYHSLIRQTCKDFEWIIIDDGSVDCTRNLIESFIKEDKICIRYKYVKNGGKTKAINRGVEMAEGRLFFIVDSDDYITDNAIERILYWESTIDKKSHYCGVSGNRGNKRGELWGTTFKGEYTDCTALERKQNNITGDKSEVYYTNILKRFPFPEIDGERYIPLAYVWQGIAYAGYKMRWFNEIIYIGEYLEDGLTNKYQSLLNRNPKGTALYKIKECEYFNYSFKMKINSYYQYYTRFSDALSMHEIAQNLQCSDFLMKYIVLRFKIRRLVKGEAYR